MSFSITNKGTSKQETAAVGEDPNEKVARENDTESATQYPRAYTYSYGSTQVRIIDTPAELPTLEVWLKMKRTSSACWRTCENMSKSFMGYAFSCRPKCQDLQLFLISV